MLFRAVNQPSTRFPSDPSRWPSGSSLRMHYGQRILWHPLSDGGRHLSAEELSVYQNIGDVELDELLNLLEDDSGCPISPGKDVVAAILNASTLPPKPSRTERALHSFYKKYAIIPSWVDMDQLKRGQDVFLSYLSAIGISLYYRSLVPGFSIPPLAHVLKCTGYLAPPATKERVRERLLDTFAFLVLGLTSGDALLPVSGEGWKACLQVRVLHAKVRRSIRKRNGKRSWDYVSNGIPINEEDMAATLLAFSLNALVGAEILLGFPLPEQERRDYLAVWRYMGWLLGVRVNHEEDQVANNNWQSETDTRSIPRALDPCGPGWFNDRPDSLAHSKAIFESILTHTLRPDASSIEVSHYLLRQGRSGDPKAKNNISDENWFYYRCLQCRRFVGDALGDALEIPLNPNVWYRWRSWLFSTAFLLTMSLYTAAALPWFPFRGWIVSFHRKRLIDMLTTWSPAHHKRVEKHMAADGRGETCRFAMLTRD